MPIKSKNDTPETFLLRIYKNLSGTDKFAFLSGAITCLLVNMFVYTNTCFVHDSIKLYSDSTGIQNGRILAGPLFALLNRMQMPWVIGFVSSILFGLVIVYLAKIFQIKSKTNIIILAGIVITSDTIVVSHIYFGSLYIYALSLLLSVMAVYYADRKRYGFIISVSLLSLSVIMYQAYLASAVCLFLYKLIFDLQSDRKNKERILQIAKYVLITGVAVALFYIIWKVVLKISGEEVVGTYAYDNMGLGSSINDFSNRIINSLRLTFIKLFPLFDLSQAYPLKYIISLLTVISFISFAFLQDKVDKILYYFVYSITFVFSVNLMYFLSGAASYELTTFSYIFPILGLLYLIENQTKLPKMKLKKQLTWCVSVLCIVLIAGQSIYANSLYLKIKVNYDNAWSYATRLVDRIEQTEGFNKDTKVALVGYNHESGGSKFRVTEYKRNIDIQYAVNYCGAYKNNDCIYSSNNAITYPKTLEWFITQEMDMAIDIEGNPEEFRNDKQIDNMGIFPSGDSIKWIGDTLIVRVS